MSVEAITDTIHEYMYEKKWTNHEIRKKKQK